MIDINCDSPKNPLYQVVDFRAASIEDLPFLCTCLYHSFHSRKDLSSKLVKTIIDNITIAHDKNNPDQIVGFIMHDVNELAIHFLYVKLPFRKLGIANAMINYVFGTVPPKYYTLNCHRPDFIVKKLNIKYKPILLLSSLIKD